jgi:hypothetical protein
MISAIYNFALTTGANRVIKGARIEHVCGDPTLSPEKDYAFGMRIVRTALDTLTIAVPGPTLFDPMAPGKEGFGVLQSRGPMSKDGAHAS